MQKTSRNILLDIFKVIAALFVIGTHCGFLFEYSEVASQTITNGVFRIAVPFFFCVNGFFLYNVFNDDRIQKWFKRVGILYLIWMLFYTYFWAYLNDFNLMKMILTIIFGFNHLWYLAALLLGGLLLYQLRNISNKLLIVGTFILFLIGIIIQYLGQLHVFSEQLLLDKLMNYPPLHRNFLLFALPLLSIGYVIKRANFHTKLSKSFAISLLILSLVLLVAENLITYYFITGEAILNTYISYIFLAPALLITAFTFTVSSNLNSKLLSSYSIALYLIHPLIIFLILRFFKLDSTPLTFITIILSVIASYALIQLNKKLKYIL
ncbi:acyltransferase family protein [Kordia algicida OT-1]|uniref:Acyltransferase family protein n=1 Tax=Kordia algicida OT-1 TaxID=391587 RepID=A9DP30_9FLAO|nr:acyltransferase family protein [Kordia algicida]EDP97341.1 acyltransferase family protein [Kordia algicida OT-1]